jgi:hypothetical protein
MPDEPMLRKIVDQFASPRTRLLVTGSDRAARPTVEVAHEALIRTWPRLRDWVNANREKLHARATIVQAKAAWEEHGRREDLLLPAGFQLERARALASEPGDITIDDIREFISESEAAEARRAQHEHQRQATRRRLRRIVGLLLAVVAFGALATFGYYAALQKSTGALYAAHAEALLGAAVSDRGAQWPPDLRARATLKAFSYFDDASKLGVQWFSDKFAEGLVKDIWYLRTGKRLPILTSQALLERARSAFDFTSRVVLGRSFVIIKAEDTIVEAEPAKCAFIMSSNDRVSEWRSLPRLSGGDKRQAQRAFRILEGGKLQFGAANEAGITQEADADFQDSLPLGAQLCVSSDATVLTISSPGRSVPDLYDLQWTPCGRESECKKNKHLEWRVRAVRISLAIGPDDLRSATLFPCVFSIINIPVNASAGQRRQNPARVHIRYTAEEAGACLKNGAPVARGLRPGERKSPQSFVAEFYTELAVPKTIDIPDSVTKSFAECKNNIDPTSTPILYAEFICRPKYYVDNGSMLENDTYIGIQKRRNEQDILEIDVLDLATFSARKISLPASHVDRAGVTSTGEVLLHDDDAGVTWRFVVSTTALEERLRERGCSQVQKSDPKAVQDLDELAELDIDSVCLNIAKSR